MDRGAKRLIYIFIAIFVFVFLWWAVGFVSRVGKAQLTINVAPRSADITINGKAGHGGVNYVKPGKYTVVAKKDGFSEVTRTLVVNSNQSINMLLEPQTEGAQDYLTNNPEERKAYEDLTAEVAKQKGDAQRKSTPLITKLPYTDLIGPFSVDYGPDSNEGQGGVIILVSDSTAPGRYAAQQWIQDQGQALSEANVIYTDFVNPLAQGEGRGH